MTRKEIESLFTKVQDGEMTFDEARELAAQSKTSQGRKPLMEVAELQSYVDRAASLVKTPYRSALALQTYMLIVKDKGEENVPFPATIALMIKSGKIATTPAVKSKPAKKTKSNVS